MPKWLSQEWLDEQKKLAADQPERPGATARMQYVLNRANDEPVKYYWVLEDGKLTESTLGQMDEPELTLIMSYDDAMKVQKGELDEQAAFMQGRIKVEGNMAKLMALMPITSSPEYRALQDKIREITDY
ncbi:MAG TPA: SCP2 sterol-binding domain-containing protein [Acidimicrobiales bacterium]|nr:SCP2 sterol-binding domain-containing protein [Acidimicrobiales bacterium]